MENKYKIPPIVWLRVTDYMHAWLENELGGALRVQNQLVLSVQHLPGAREILRMETTLEIMEQKKVKRCMSSTWKNCIDYGITLDPKTIEKTYGITSQELKLFVPIECPKNSVTKNGVLRPWTGDTNFGWEQAGKMQDLLRREFWKAVSNFNKKYAEKMGGHEYPAINMIEAFCEETGTPEIYVDAMRREWQRRIKREDSYPPEEPTL